MKLPFASDAEKTEYATGLRKNLKIESFIHPSVTVPSWVELGKRVTVHAGCILGSDGFFLAKQKNGIRVRIPHTGKLIIEDDVEIFPNTIIDRGLVGNTMIRRGAQIAHQVMISHDCEIGENVMIMMSTVLAGYVSVGNLAAIGTHATILQHIKVGERAFVGAGSLVRKNVAAETVVAGNPARVLVGKKPPHL